MSHELRVRGRAREPACQRCVDACGAVEVGREEDVEVALVDLLDGVR